MSQLKTNHLSGTIKPHDRRVKAICQECALGCGLIEYIKEGTIVDIHGDEDHPVGRGRVCARGMAFIQDLTNPDRVFTPAERKTAQGPLEDIEDWEKALDLCSEKVRKIRDQHGSGAVAIHCDRGAGLEFVIGAMRFAELLGTPHLHHDLFSDFSDFPAPPPSYKWPQCRSILCVDADVAAAHPVAFGWVLDSVKGGTKLLAADALFTRTMAKAGRKWRIRPGSGNLLGVAMTKMILEEKLHPGGAAAVGFKEHEEWAASYKNLPWDGLLSELGLRREELKELCRLLAEAGPALLITGKELAGEPHYDIWPTITAFMGWSEDNNGGWYPLRHVLPPLNPYRDLEGVALTDAKGRHSDGVGPVKAILGSAMALNDLLSHGGAFGDLDWITCFGSFPGIAHTLSHLFLPALLWPERDTLCFTSDRAVHWCERTVEPASGCRSGLDFWLGMAKRFGWANAFPWAGEDGTADHRAFFQWVLDGSRATAGCTLSRLSESSLSSALYFWSGDRKDWGAIGIEPMSAPAQIGPCIPLEPGYPLVFKRMEPVSRSGEAGPWRPWTQGIEREDLIRIHPVTAAALGIENGDEVLVSSAGGSWEAFAWINRCVPEGMVSAPGRVGGKSVLVQRKDRTREETLNLLMELIP